MKKREDHLEKEMAEVLLQNKRLTEPLQRARDEVNELRKKLAHYEQDKSLLAVSSPPPPASFLNWGRSFGSLAKTSCSAGGHSSYPQPFAATITPLPFPSLPRPRRPA